MKYAECKINQNVLSIASEKGSHKKSVSVSPAIRKQKLCYMRTNIKVVDLECLMKVSETFIFKLISVAENVVLYLD